MFKKRLSKMIRVERFIFHFLYNIKFVKKIILENNPLNETLVLNFSVFTVEILLQKKNISE